MVAVTLAAIDISKEENQGNEPHGSKVIAVPFDGASLDRDLQKSLSAVQPRESSQPSRPPPTGKLAPRPLYRDPPFDAPTDPVLCYHEETKRWFLYYTARRATATNAPGVQWVHGSNIGIAERTPKVLAM